MGFGLSKWCEPLYRTTLPEDSAQEPLRRILVKWFRAQKEVKIKDLPGQLRLQLEFPDDVDEKIYAAALCYQIATEQAHLIIEVRMGRSFFFSIELNDAEVKELAKIMAIQ